jgi:thioesterase domain-containing protein
VSENEKKMPTLTEVRIRTSEILLPIWQRVLERSTIGVDDNFFDLGGDLSAARKLFAEISQVFGRDLSPVTVLETPTIKSLAAFLESGDSPRIPTLVQMKTGAEQPAVFITHGIGSNLLELSQLVRNIQTDRPVYGLQTRGADGVDEPFDRIEDMAQSYVEAVRKAQPSGPYLLIGYSMGGLVTLEMAQRLSAMGERIASLVLIESFPARDIMPAKQRARLYFRLLRNHLSNARQLPLPEAISYILHPSKRIHRSSHGHAESPPEQRSLYFGPAMQRMRDADYRALASYRPRYYPGKIHFVKAENSFDFPDDAAAVWAGLSAGFVVENVPGDHFAILDAYSEDLGSVLSRYLDEAVL